MQTLDEFRKLIEAYNPSADFELLSHAYTFAEERHQGEERKSGAPYFSHCIETAKTLVELQLDMETICAGLLHDVLEDTYCTPKEMEALFGKSVTNLVMGVTKISKLPFKGGRKQNSRNQDENSTRRDERQAENYRNMLLAMAGDVRVILIKLADRLHNMRTLEYLEPHKQIAIARETLDIFAPLGHRLGIATIKSELEDLAFKYLEPVKYREIQHLVNEKRIEREAYTRGMAALISEVLARESITAEVFGRPKHFYSIYQKMVQKRTPFEDIYDLIAFRVLLDTKEDCWRALGVIHDTWVPIPGRFRDFINLRKSNGYQSIHTTVQIKTRRVEIQIRTHEMHQTAEYGIAAHWSYKEGLPGNKAAQFKWLRQMVENLQEVHNPELVFKSIEADLTPDEVYIFTPRGDLLALRAGATPLDFAYAIHTDLGHRCVGAKVNGSIVPLRHPLQTGDQVQILTDIHAKPGRDWLRIAQTPRARAKIRRWLNEQERAQNLEIGTQLLENGMLKRRLNPRQYMRSPELQTAREKLGYNELEDLLVHIGQGKISVEHLLNTMFPKEEEEPTKEEEDQEERRHPQRHAISIGGIEHAVLRIANCCKPLPGEPVIGFITRGRGVSVHHANCSRIVPDSERLVQVDWPSTEVTYTSQIVVYADDRKGLLGDIATAIGKSEVNIIKNDGGPVDPFTACHRFVVEVVDIDQLHQAMRAIQRVKGVQNVERKLPKGAIR